MTRELNKLSVIVAVALAGRRLRGRARVPRRADEAMRAGDLDQAVAFYRTAVQASPDNPNYKIALERAMQAASRVHFEKAREFEAQDQLEAARGEYRLAAEYDPTNRTAAPRSRARSDAPPARRSGAAQARHRAAARAGAGRVGAADSQSGVARAADPAGQQLQRARSRQLRRIGDRHQHHLRPRAARIGRSRFSSTA